MRAKKPDFDDAARIFVEKLKESAEFDAVIVPSLYIQRAALTGTKASWDGVERTIEVDAPGRGVIQVPDDAPIEGAAPAASLHAVVLDAAGNKLQETRTGLVLLVRARLATTEVGEPSFTFVPIQDPFADREHLTEGIAKALSPFIVPRSEEPSRKR